MRMVNWILVHLGLAALAATPAGAASSRLALVIGNSAYSGIRPVPNAAADATVIRIALEDAGFKVMDAIDQPKAQLSRSLAEFRDRVSRAEAGSVALVYYAGHGFSLADEPVLLPVDARVAGGAIAPAATLQLSALVDAASANRSAKGVVVVDACRDLLEFRHLGLAPGGLAPRVRPSNAFIAFSASRGYSAHDGEKGGHSPFARAFLEELAEPGQPIGVFFEGVAKRVFEQTGHAQQPDIPVTKDPLVLNDKPVSIARALHYRAHETWSAGDRLKGTELHRQAAKLGDTRAMIAYADRLYYGGEIPANIDDAIVWYHSAAQRGETEGWLALGQVHLNHPKGARVADAVSWFEKGAEAGNRESMFHLALMLQDDTYGRKDVARAIGLYERSLEAYNCCSAVNLARLFAVGKEVPMDLTRARRYAQLAADRGNVKGIDALAYIALKARDYHAARRHYELGASRGSAFALLQLGVIQANGWGVERNLRAARDYFVKGLNRAQETKDQEQIASAREYLEAMGNR